MKYFILSVIAAIALVNVTNPAWAADQEIDQLRQQLFSQWIINPHIKI